MSTRSSISVEHRDGTWKSVYCHWDGYPEHVGRLLLDHYDDQDRAELLVNGGNISSLDARCDLPPGHTHATPVKGYTVYYARDRGESGQDATVGATLEEATGDRRLYVQYCYVWCLGRGWFIETYLRLKDLKSVL